MKLIFRGEAKQDIKEIHTYLKEFGKEPVKNFKNTLRNFEINIKKYPKMFPEFELLPQLRMAVLVYDYIAFYKVDETAKTIIVFHVLHGSRNLTAILRKT